MVREAVAFVCHQIMEAEVAAQIGAEWSGVTAEKMRALAERCRPRDLYGVIHIRHPDLLGQAPSVAGMLARKSAFVGIAIPTPTTVRETPFREEIEGEWSNMLRHQLPELPPFEQLSDELQAVFAWLGGDPPGQPSRGPGSPASPSTSGLRLRRRSAGEPERRSSSSASRAPTAFSSMWTTRRRMADAGCVGSSRTAAAEPRQRPAALRRERIAVSCGRTGSTASGGVAPTRTAFRPRYLVEF